MIERKAIRLISSLASQFPVILILGPRQCGRTTPAKGMLEGEYFDLEKPSDRQLFEGVIDRGMIVYSGGRRFQPVPSVEVMPADELLGA